MPVPGDLIPQLDSMRMGVAYGFKLRLRNFEARCRPLSLMETTDVANAVADIMGGLPLGMRNRLSEHTLLAKQTLMRATSSDVGANDGELTDYIMDRMTPDEVSAIFKQYIAGCDRCNPMLDKMKPAEVVALVEELKKSQPDAEALALQLTELSSLQLINLASYLLTSAE